MKTPHMKPAAYSYSLIALLAVVMGLNYEFFIFPNAFVVDYSESYSTYSGEGNFCLMIRQKKDKNSDVVVEGETTDLDLN